MSDIKSIAELRTGDPKIDEILDKAYNLGYKYGHISTFESARIDLTRRHLAHIMRNLNIDLQAAMVLLCIPRAERKIYTKHFEKLPKSNK